MRRAVHAGALLSVLVATVAASAASVAARALTDVSAQYGRATPRVPLPFEVTEATCRRFTIGVVQQDGAGSLTVEVNDRVAHRQAGVHLGPPIQGWWPRNLLLVGENSFRVTAYVHSRLHIFNGKFQCPNGLGLATPMEPPVPTPTATPRAPIVGPPGKGFTPSPTATEAPSTPGDATATATPSSVPTVDDPPSPTADPSTASPEATSQQSPTPSASPTPTALVTGVSTASLGQDDPIPTPTPASATTEDPGASPPADQPSPDPTPTPIYPGVPTPPRDHNPPPINLPPDRPWPSPLPAPVDPGTPPPPAGAPKPPDVVHDPMPPEIERLVDIVRGGGGYSESDRQQMAAERKWRQAQVLDPSTTAHARQQHEAGIAEIDRKAGTHWTSPFADVPPPTFQDAWTKRYGLLLALIALLITRIVQLRRAAVRRRLREQSSAANVGAPQLVVSQEIGSAHLGSPAGEAHISLTPEERGGTPVGSEHTWSKRVSPRRDRTARRTSATVSRSSAVSAPAEPREPSSVGVTALTATERYGQDPKSAAAQRALSEIVIPTHRAARMDKIVVDGQPGVRFDRDSTLFYPLTNRRRRVTFSMHAAADRPLQMTQINELYPEDLKCTYQSALPIWHEGTARIPSKIYAHNIIRQTCKDGPWVLDLDALPPPAASVEPPETA